MCSASTVLACCASVGRRLVAALRSWLMRSADRLDDVVRCLLAPKVERVRVVSETPRHSCVRAVAATRDDDRSFRHVRADFGVVQRRVVPDRRGAFRQLGEHYRDRVVVRAMLAQGGPARHGRDVGADGLRRGVLAGRRQGTQDVVDGCGADLVEGGGRRVGEARHPRTSRITAVAGYGAVAGAVSRASERLTMSAAPRLMSRRLPWMTRRWTQDFAPEFWMRSMRRRPRAARFVALARPYGRVGSFAGAKFLRRKLLSPGCRCGGSQQAVVRCTCP